MKENVRRRLGRPPSSESKVPVTDKILAAANKLFMERGYDPVSVDEIAKACGITKATIYYYYPSKAELITASLLRLMENIRKATYGILIKPIPLSERLLEITRIHIQVTSFDFETVMRKLEGVLTKEQILEMRKAEEAIANLLAEEFRKSSESGEIGKVDPKVAAHAYMSLLMLGQAKSAEGTSLFSNAEEAARQIISLLWHGMFPEKI